MRSRLLPLFLASTLAPGAFAQIELFRNVSPAPGPRVSSRGTIPGPGTGWLCQRYPALGVSRIGRVRAVVQDQDCTTRSTTRIALMGESSTPGTPDENRMLYDSGPFLMPGGVNTCAWSFTMTPPSPISPPSSSMASAVFTAVLLDAAPLWTQDGSSSWRSSVR